MALTVFTGESDLCEALADGDRERMRWLVDEYIRQTADACKAQFLCEIQPREYEAGCTILDAPREQQVAIVVDTAARLAKCGAWDCAGPAPLKSLLSALLRKDLPFNRSSMESLLHPLRANGNWWQMPLGGILRAVERYIERHGMTETMREGLESLQRNYNSNADYAEERKLGQRIESIVKHGNHEVTRFDLNTGEAWTDALLVQLGRLDNVARAHWQALFAHCATAKSSKPSKKWLKTAAQQMAPIGEQAFVEVIIPCLAAIGLPGASREVNHGGWTHHTDPTQIHDTHADLLRGLVWSTALVSSEELIGAVGGAADMCFRKIPNIGPRSPKIGNACLHALSEMNHLAAVAQISRLKARAKHVSIRKQLAKGLERAADKVGMTGADLEEIAVPTFGLHDVGRYEKRLGDFTAELDLSQNGRPQLVWRKPDGKMQKTIPAAIKETHAAEIKALKQKAKEIEQQVPALRNRIEQLCLKQRSWNLCEFRQRFLDHPLVGAIARRVIWRFQAEDRTADGVWHNGKLVDSQDHELDWIDDETTVTIWHPILSEADEVLRWREWLVRHEVCQPFKQAHREIYILTDAERDTGTYSNRFAAHIIRQHQFAALCQQQGWRYSLEGAWDSANTPYLELPQWGLRTEYWVEAVESGQASEMGIFLYLSTDQVRFSRLTDVAAGFAGRRAGTCILGSHARRGLVCGGDEYRERPQLG